MLQTNSWPSDTQYLMCDEFSPGKTPKRPINLRKFFKEVDEPTTYGKFIMPDSPTTDFNGNSFMEFDMDISAVSVRGGASVNTKNLGSWTAGLNSALKVSAADDIANLSAATVYRVFTVVVCYVSLFIIRDSTISFLNNKLFSSKHHLLYVIQIIRKVTKVTVLIFSMRLQTF